MTKQVHKIVKRSRNAEYKPLLFTTTIRNPERFKDFMFILHKYNNQILTNEVIEEVEKDIFTYGLYRPTKRIPATVKAKWASTRTGEFAEEALTPEEAKAVYDGNDPEKWPDIKGHKEAGFDKGWPSRFDTQYKLMQILGFVKYAIGSKIVFSEVGKYLANSICIEIKDGIIDRHPSENPQYEQMAFLQAFAKYQRCNPFIRELNDNIPLILLLQVIRKLNANPNYNNCGISYKEIPLVLFWKNNDADALYRRIVELRMKYGFTPSDEVIENICVNEILGGFKAFKLKSIISEYPDEFIRKMRMTGLISFRGAGRFIDINHCEDQKIDYIIKNYSAYKKIMTTSEFFDYMSKIDPNLFLNQSLTITHEDIAKKLAQWTSVYSWEQIKKELGILSSKTSSKDDILKFISAPARLEFLTALALKSKLPHVDVVPNYICDDEGLPTSTAGGNKGDIECFEDTDGILIEVTMAEGRQQTMMEVWPISRHLSEFINNYKRRSQCVFIAPTIFSDTTDQIEWTRDKKNLTIRPYTIGDFITYLDSTKTLFYEK